MEEEDEDVFALNKLRKSIRVSKEEKKLLIEGQWDQYACFLFF